MDPYKQSARNETAQQICTLAITVNDLEDGKAKQLALRAMEYLVADLAPPPVLIDNGSVIMIKR